jgi:tetratricopeptide (TPR) repeat protein
LRAYWHEQQGRVGEAFQDLEEARKAAPADPIILNAFGLCAARLGRMDEAFAAFEAAAQADPNFSQAHFNGAWAAEALGEMDRARAGYRRAIEIAPTAVEAHASLAWLCARTAAWDEARAAAARALALAPERPIAHLALATADLHDGNVDGAEGHIRDVLALQTLSRLDRGIAFGLLGDCMDKRGNAEAAFEAYLKSNALFREEYGEDISSRSRETVSSMVTWLNAYFATAQNRDWQPRAYQRAADGPRTHVFLVGFPRSGTTLLEQILASHPLVVSMDEKEALADAVRDYMRSPATLDRLRQAGDAELDAARARYWARVRGFALDPGGKIFVDKLALNTIKLPLIARLFPNAKILLALRDPRDVVWGCFRQRFQMNAAMLEFTTLEGASQLYAGCMGLLATYMKVFTLDIHAIRNEDLVSNFDLEARQVCDFIDAPWDNALRSFAERRHQRAISTPSSVQVARGLYVSGGQWRPYARQLQPILPLLQPWVERFGYGGA